MMFLLIVTIASMLLAVIMSVVAWRVAGEERRRSDARVAALTAEIHGTGDTVDDPSRDPDLEIRPAIDTRGAGDLFAPAAAPSGSRLAGVMAGGVIVFGAAVTLALFMSSGSGTSASKRHATIDTRPSTETAASPVTRANPANPDAPATLPLELVALGHDRAGDTLTVRGVVRNPPTGTAVGRLTAVVFAFNRDGGFLGSGRASVESPELGPGGESTFVVTVPDAGDVGRYRVSFRTDDHVVPHVDRREQALAKS